VVKLEIKLFAGLTCKNEDLPSSGQNEFILDAPVGITVSGLHELLKLGPVPLITVVNGIVEKKDFAISGQARVGIFPPIAGGIERQ
jgi:molybdopterin converting factor small subunit